MKAMPKMRSRRRRSGGTLLKKGYSINVDRLLPSAHIQAPQLALGLVAEWDGTMV
jgi:hypothetical protein